MWAWRKVTKERNILLDASSFVFDSSEHNMK